MRCTVSFCHTCLNKWRLAMSVYFSNFCHEQTNAFFWDVRNQEYCIAYLYDQNLNFDPVEFIEWICFCHWRKSRGGGGWGMYPPLFWVGDGLYKYRPPPPTCWTINYQKKTIKKLSEIARSLRSLAHKCIPRLDLCGFASTCILFLTSFM